MDCHVRYYVFANMPLESALPGLVISAFLKGFSFNVLLYFMYTPQEICQLGENLQ